MAGGGGLWQRVGEGGEETGLSGGGSEAVGWQGGEQMVGAGIVEAVPGGVEAGDALQLGEAVV